MRKLVCLIALVAIPAVADDASKRAKIGELMDLMNMKQTQEQMFASIKQMAMAQAPAAAKDQGEMAGKLMDLIRTRMSWEVMKPEYEQIYMETFTEPEVDGIVGFYKSPAGKAMIAKMPELMQKSMGIAQKRMQDIGPEIQKMVKEAQAEKK